MTTSRTKDENQYRSGQEREVNILKVMRKWETNYISHNARRIVY